MKYLHVIQACAAEPWAMHSAKLRAVVDVLAFQAYGGKLDDTEIEARVSDRRANDVTRAPGAVAILPIYGILSQRQNMMQATSGGTSVEIAQQAFRTLMADDQVKATVMNFDSPGGMSNGIEEFSQEIFNARGIKPIVAQVDSTAASAALWLASACDEIVCTPGGSVGSVGVFAVHEEMSKALESEGITRTLISSGGIKGTINDFMPLSEEAKAEIASRVAYVDGLFVKALARNRGVAQSAVPDQFGRGEMFSPKAALDRGLIDRIAPLSETLARFGAAAPMLQRRGAVTSLRAAAAAGDFSDIPPSTVEDAMRDAFGLSKSQAAASAGHVLKALRRGDPDEGRSESGDQPAQQTAPTPAASDLIARISASAAGFSKQG
jgi:signal peptide peptidase SppA